jgi:AraC-like DNA-binding protein
VFDRQSQGHGLSERANLDFSGDLAAERNGDPMSATMVIANGRAPSVRQDSFSTLALPKLRQFDGWREVCSIVDVNLGEDAQPSQGFLAEMTGYDLRSFHFGVGKFDGEQYERTPDHIRKDPVDYWILTLRKSGFAVSRDGDLVLHSPSGCLELRSMGHAYRGKSSRTEALYAFLPRDAFAGIAPQLDVLNHTVLTGALTPLLSEYLLSLEKHLPAMTVAEIPSVTEATKAIITACLAPSRENAATAKEPLMASQLEQARRYIQKHLQSPSLTPDLLCHALGVSRRHLYHLFERHGGVAAYIRRRRLRACHAAIIDSAEPRRIKTIAYDHGFTDPALFSRLFRAEFGYSPNEARDANTLGLVVRETPPATLEDWLA